MQPDTQTLDEVVVIGYGTVKKRDLTGAVASVKSEDIVRMPTSNVLEAIQGQYIFTYSSAVCFQENSFTRSRL